MADITLTFLLAGVMLVLGFLGDYLFKRTGIPDILILIGLGFMLGPLFKIIDVNALAPITPIFASLALLIILFNGGLNMNLFKTLKSSPRAAMLAIVGTILSMVGVAVFMNVVLGWDWITGFLLGAVVSGTSSAIVIPIVSRMTGMSQKLTNILNLEAVFTDATVVVIGLTLLQFLSSAPTVYSDGIGLIFAGITSQFSIGIVIGLGVALFWMRIMRAIKGSMYNDVLTLAVVLLFYFVTESVGGSGAIFALTFGLMLANGFIISRMLKIKKVVEADKVMKKFQSQISFLIRTFFFVYLGLIISFQNTEMMIYGILLGGILLATRYASVVLTSMKNPEMRRGRLLLTLMLPRGLAAAVVAQVVSSSQIPYANFFTDIVVAVIVTTVLISSAGPLLAKYGIAKGRGIKISGFPAIRQKR